METIVYLNVDEKSIYTQFGFLHFTGREGDEEAQRHHLNLTGIKRWKFLNDTLTVVFFPDDEAPQRPQGERDEHDFANEFLNEALSGLDRLAKELGVDLEKNDVDN